jgi:peptide/nickel transport system ATP-binding protein
VCLLPVLASNRALLEVRDLSVCYDGESQPCPAVLDLSFSVAAGEVLGIQGRSGCGKTSTALALLKLLPRTVTVTGSVLFENRELLCLPESELRQIRGRNISMVYQDAGLALNPVMRIGDQVGELLYAHSSQNSRQRRDRVNQMLESVHLKPERFYHAYPHELSGGEKSRVLLAQALVCGPSLVIADEPTAGLDPALKNEILDLIAKLRADYGAAFVLISHDRAILERLADRTIELQNKRQQQDSGAQSIVPASKAANETVGPLRTDVLIRARNLTKWYGTRGLFKRKPTEKRALNSADLTIPKGSLVAIVGPSGSGKSTLARCLSLLERPDAGKIFFDGKDLLSLNNKQLREHRPLLQYIAQNFSEALNPRLTAGEAIEEPLLIQGNSNAANRHRAVEEIAQQVGLDSATLARSCHEFSGGQKQRLVIARALMLEPQLLILDESLSGLDPETQKGILDLLLHLKRTLGVTQLLISHDLELVAKVADSVAVMRDGSVIEHASSKQIVADPAHWSSEHLLHTSIRQELVLAEAE